MPLNNINNAQSMKEILKHLSFDSVLLLDLDNTVIESSIELGSDAWFVQLCTHAIREITDSEQAIFMAIHLYHEIQKIVRAQAVEEVTVKIINTLQIIGIPVIAITARDHCLEQATIRQLHDIGIDLDDQGFAPIALSLTTTEQAFYSNGIIYCAGKDKGACFSSFLQTSNMKPGHIVMADDKLKHLEHVRQAVEHLGIPFDGIRYGHLDTKVAEFNFNEAHHQLASVKSKLSDKTNEYIRILGIEQNTPTDLTRYRHYFYSTPAVTQEARESASSRNISSI